MSASSKTIIVDLIRHGEPEGGEVLRGRIDPVLTERGWARMRTAVGLSPGHEPSATTPRWTQIISSPLQRCRAFAERTARQSDLELIVEDHWQEIDYGDWDGMPVKEWRKVAAAQFRAFRENPAALAPPNGEPWPQFRERVLNAWRGLAGKPDGSHVLLVTHGGVLRVILPSVLGMRLNHSSPLHIPFACYSRVRMEVQAGQMKASLVFHNAAARLADD